MSEHSHIDKVFKDGLGERNFSNVDAMWERMDKELDKEDKKKRPVIFFVTAAVVLLAGFGVSKYLNKPTVIVAEHIPAYNTAVPAVNKSEKQSRNISAINNSFLRKNNSQDHKNHLPVDVSPAHVRHSKSRENSYESRLDVSVANQENILNTDEISFTTYEGSVSNWHFEKIITDAAVIGNYKWQNNNVAVLPLKKSAFGNGELKAKQKRELPKPSKISIELVGGGDLIRMNRKAGFYAGVRVNKNIDNGATISAGVNFASHVIGDKYRVRTKPADQVSSDARINSINSVRVPVYFQRQIGKSKLSMMVGLVPIYITKAEVYNVPNSYIGDPNPYRKFSLDDINRFNLLFGTGLRYSPSKWMSLELSGSYGLTGMVKDGYKNLSRVNDNFKSIQLGAAFRLK
jgi:hypothetical protein